MLQVPARVRAAQILGREQSGEWTERPLPPPPPPPPEADRHFRVLQSLVKFLAEAHRGVHGFVMDEEGRKMYPVARSIQNDKLHRYDWSPDNLKEVENGILERADSLTELAAKAGIPEHALAETLTRWNRMVDAGQDEEFGRLPETMVAIRTPPYYFGRAYPIVINTQGGPVHDPEQRVLNPFGEPIPRLFAAGELGSVFGHLYLGGGNLSECVIGGWTAGRNAARQKPWD